MVASEREADLVEKNAALKAENAELKGQMGSVLDRLAALEEPKPAEPTQVKRTPVTA